jgi:hypothetical protein
VGYFAWFTLTFYKRLACAVGRTGGGGGDNSTGAGIDGHETVFGGGGRLLFEDFRAVGSAFGAGVIATSAAGEAIGSGSGFFVLFQLRELLFRLHQVVLHFRAAVRELRCQTRNLLRDSFDFRNAIRYCCPQARGV